MELSNILYLASDFVLVLTIQLGVNYMWVEIEVGFPGGSNSKESACDAGDPGLIPGLGISPGEGNIKSLQYSCLENSMDRGTWQTTVHGVTKSDTTVRLTEVEVQIAREREKWTDLQCDISWVLTNDPYDHISSEDAEICHSRKFPCAYFQLILQTIGKYCFDFNHFRLSLNSFEFHINGIMWCILCVWLPLLNISILNSFTLLCV